MKRLTKTTYGVQRKAAFTKVVGGWRFEWGRYVFFAHHNEAGFAGRAWELQVLTGYRDGVTTLPMYAVLEGDLPSRQACVDAAAESYPPRVGLVQR